MKQVIRHLILALSIIVMSGPVSSAPRNPQVPVIGGGLQAYLISVGESINVQTDQEDAPVWSHALSGDVTCTIQFQSSPNAFIQQIGIYNSTAVIPPLFFLMSGSVGPLGFSTFSFRPGNIVVVNRFDALGNFLGTTTFGGVDPAHFGFYLTTPGGTVFSQDERNPGSSAHMLVFPGHGRNSGSWWVAFDELDSATAGDQDFDDLVMLCESVNPVPPPAGPNTAGAPLRATQIPVLGGTLQGYLNGVGESINVSTDQRDVRSWTSSVANDTALTLQVELSPNAGGNTVGIYNTTLAAPPLYQVLPGAAGQGWFAVASFRTAPVRVVVNLFDANKTFQGANTYLGADRNNFGFYLQRSTGEVLYSEDIRNPGGKAQALAFAGTGVNTGSWWVAFEDTDASSGSDQDFDDAVVFVDSANPAFTPPDLHCPQNAELACGSSTAPADTGTATATAGTCPGDPTIGHTDQATAANCTGVAGIDRTWTATDACGQSASCVQHITFVDHTAPVIHPTGTPADGVLGCNPTSAQIGMALGSATADDDCGGTVTPSPSTGGDVPNGCSVSRTRTWSAVDACGNPAVQVSRTATWTSNSQAPSITGVTATPSTLWPPNHTMRDVTIDYTVSDDCPDAIAPTLSVSSNEPVNGTGDGDTSPDWQIVDAHHVRLRAERSGSGTGRIYTVTITAADACGASSTATASVVVAHNIVGPPSGAAFKINTPVNLSGTFWDVPANRHTAQWTLDGLAVAGIVTEPSGLRPGTVTGTTTLTSAGVYKVTMTLTDQTGGRSWVDTAGDVEAIVVAYDPSAGYTIGGGWFASPAGAYRANPSVSGKVSFGFTSKYFRNASNPKGETQFQFKLAGIEFNALTFDYLAISGAKAQLKGFGKLNGDAGYNFILTVIDGQAAGGGGTDRIRMKIWNKTTGAIVYDSQMGASDAADPTLPVGSGSSITIVTTNAPAP
jgi:hypothetical protein